MIRILSASLLSFFAALATAQSPDVQFKLDLGPTFWNGERDDDTVTWYDAFGRHSIAALQFALEPGFRAYVSQRIQRISNDRDRSTVDESYVEDVGVWRAGKQYLPFGRRAILRESAVAVRSDTELFLRVLPMTIAACDGGSSRQSGVIGRIGSDFGVSFAVGRRFGSGSSSLSGIRRPEEATMPGFKQVLGADYLIRKGAWTFAAEYARFADGEDDQESFDALDLSLTLAPSATRSVTFGFTSISEPSLTAMRILGSFQAAPSVWIEPWYRTRDGSFLDGGVTARVRL